MSHRLHSAPHTMWSGVKPYTGQVIIRDFPIVSIHRPMNFIAQIVQEFSGCSTEDFCTDLLPTPCVLYRRKLLTPRFCIPKRSKVFIFIHALLLCTYIIIQQLHFQPSTKSSKVIFIYIQYMLYIPELC